tara:strand:- start:502 stop:747 length:246 start_codon:yes stop_codon:yes gene_type:complete
MKVVETVEDFVKKQELKVRQKVRNRAVANAETSLILAGRKINELTVEEWEHLVADEEREVWEKYMKGGVVSMIAIAFFGVP